MGFSYPWQNRRNDLVIPTGAKRNQISIQAKSTSQDPATGEPSSTWNTVLTTLSAISTISSREMYQTGTAAQFVGQASHLVKIDWPGASIVIVSGMRVLFGTRIFLIQAPPENVQERNRVVNLTCLEIDGGAGC
jgi:head-tail adaptor